MKLKLLPILVCATLLVSIMAGCGNSGETVVEVEEQQTENIEKKNVGESSQSETEEVKESDSEKAGNEATTEASVEEATGEQSIELVEDRWMQKKPISGIITYSNAEYPLTVEYSDDGSYTYRIQCNEYDIVYYFTSNGVITKVEQYFFDGNNQNGLLKDTYYSVLGWVGSSFEPIRGFGACGAFIPKEFLSGKPILDSEGNLLSVEVDENYKAYGWSDVDITRGGDGNIVKTYIESHLSSDGYDWNNFTTEYQYPDSNTMILTAKDEQPNEYDATTRTTGAVKWEGSSKVIYNEHRQPVSIIGIDEAGEMIEYQSCVIEYNEYGFIKTWKPYKESQPGYTLTYTYEDGTSE